VVALQVKMDCPVDRAQQRRQTVNEELSGQTQWELESKKIPVFSDNRLRRQDFDKLSPTSCDELMSKKFTIFDAPEMYRSQYERLSSDEKARFNAAHGIVVNNY
jgi:hypothetical protein